ncbi:sugar porter family MFS transporter [Niabella ginsengisoli]|uniref:Sugar porter family MFS transporter n=1 Tax=Niabella ginsengisoli TaxID=522298 RepID=A0ABS9SL59_9BACT|nr:sugar porter family MFS transporter [Niabella ginsengisoli]MCH5599116.1 sugar porter family MFS transporter [Niabella ginsengisoli]
MDHQYKFNNKYIVGISFISALGGYLFGFDFAVIAGALPFLKEQFHFNDIQEGLATATLALGCIVGCALAASISDKHGRRKGLMLSAVIFLISSLAMAIGNSSAAFIIARFFAGIGVGMASVLSPMYIAEIAPANMRGRLVAINQMTVVIGIFITNLVNYSLRDQGVDAWRWMVGLGAIPSFLFLIGVLFLPESPHWLINNNKIEKAKAILLKIGGVEYAAKTQEAIKSSLTSSAKATFSALKNKAILPAVIVGIGLAVFQQLCGINVVFNYTATIFESVGFNQDDQLRQMVFIGLINMVCTAIAMWQVDKSGRKPLMLFGAAGLAILYVFSATLLKQQSATASWPLLAAIGIYAMTLAPVTWVLISEIFPNKVRGKATSVAIIALWISYALLTFTFPILAKRMGTYTPFYIYAVICVIGFVFIKVKVRETKGKSLEEMDNIFLGH